MFVVVVSLCEHLVCFGTLASQRIAVHAYGLKFVPPAAVRLSTGLAYLSAKARAAMRHPCGALFAALLCCAALQPSPLRMRAKRHRAASEDELWADTSGDDLELGGIDDVDALDRYKRRCAACAQLCVARDMAPAKVCVDVKSEAAAVIAFGEGFRRFATDTIARASTLASALPKNATFLARTPRKGPKDGKAAAFLKSRLVFERFRPGKGASSTKERTKVSASRRKFLEKRDAEKKKSAAPASRGLASPAEVSAALDEGSADDIGGVIGQDAGAAVAAASKLAEARPDELFGLAVPLREAFGLDAAFDVWPLLDVDDAALDELLGESTERPSLYDR